MPQPAQIPAPAGRRLLAGVIDGAPLLAVGGFSLTALLASPTPEVVQMTSGLSLLVVTAWWIYMTFATARRGPLGKRVCGLRVVTVDGATPSLRTAFVREGVVKVIAPLVMVGMTLPEAIPAIPLFLAVPVLWHRPRRLWAQDVLAGTVVVDARVDTQPHR